MLNKIQAEHVLNTIMDLYPNPKPSLNFDNEFQLLLAVMLSAQTTDAAVNKVTPTLFEKYQTPADLAVANYKDVQKLISSIGLYKRKTEYAIGIAKSLVENFDCKVPKKRSDLESLPGVGRKTASVVLSLTFNIPAFPVDTHITRVSKHHKIVSQNANTREIEKRICSILPPEKWHHAHLALIYFGREICHPKNPICDTILELYEY